MDLEAYVNIPKFEKFVEEQGIKINRVRGYRLMKDEKPITKDEMYEIVEHNLPYILESILTRRYDPKLGFCYYAGYMSNNQEKKYFIQVDEYEKKINWKNIHGKLRKKLKYEQKCLAKAVFTQWNMWNKFCGENILYIHAKQGIYNWSDTWRKDYENEEWYLDSCDDAFDNCYADIYAKIKDDGRFEGLNNTK